MRRITKLLSVAVHRPNVVYCTLPPPMQAEGATAPDKEATAPNQSRSDSPMEPVRLHNSLPILGATLFQVCEGY